MTQESMTEAMIIPDLSAHQAVPDDGILTRTIRDDDRLKIVLFTFSKGQELSEHTSSMLAILHFLEGEAEVTLGADRRTLKEGAWVLMPPRLSHRIRTRSAVRMLLYLVKSGESSRSKRTDAAKGGT